MEVSNNLLKFIEEIKCQFISDTSYSLPEFSVKYSEDCNGQMEYKDGYVLNIPQDSETLDKHKLAGIVYHELTHLYDIHIGKERNVDLSLITVVNEVHAAYIEFKYLLQHFPQSELMKYLKCRQQSAIDAFQAGNTFNCFKFAQYVCGFLKCLQEQGMFENQIKFELTILNAIFDDTLHQYYDLINIPFDINQDIIDKCFDLSIKMFSAIAVNHWKTFHTPPTIPTVYKGLIDLKSLVGD